MFEIGNSLRSARLRQGIDLVEAESVTKIRTKYLRALEDERFDLLPAQTYVKGFLRSYAEHLGLDGQLYVDEYNSRYATGDDDVPARPRRETPAARAHRRIESRVLAVALAGIVAVTALVVIAWKWGGSDETPMPGANAPAPPAANSPRPAAESPAKRQKPWVAVVLRAARGSSLLTVHRRSATGPLLFDGTLEQGRRMRFVGPTLWLDIGAPGNLDAYFRGRWMPLPVDPSAPAVLVATRKGFVRAGA